MVNMLIIKLAPHQLPCHQLPMMRKRRRRMRKQVCFSFTPVLDFFLLKFSFISTDLTFKRICVCENWHNELNLVWVAEGWVIWNEVFVLFSSLGYLYHFLINVIRFFSDGRFFFSFFWNAYPPTSHANKWILAEVLADDCCGSLCFIFCFACCSGLLSKGLVDLTLVEK